MICRNNCIKLYTIDIIVLRTTVSRSDRQRFSQKKGSEMEPLFGLGQNLGGDSFPFDEKEIFTPIYAKSQTLDVISSRV